MGSDLAVFASTAICLALLPGAAVTVVGLYELDATSAAVVNTCWQKHRGIQPDWLQALTGSAAAAINELPPILVAASSTPEYDHVLRQAMEHAPHLFQLQDASGSTALHHLLASAVLRGQSGRGSAFSTLSQHVQSLLFAGVPLDLANMQNQTATKSARLAIQRHRADNMHQAQREEPYLARVESLLDVIEGLQAAGPSLRFFTREVEGERQTVVRVVLRCCGRMT